MQSTSVYLYPNKIDVYTLASSWIEERNRRVYNRNLKIYRGTDNRIDLQVRNSDQKSRNVSGTVLVFNVVNKPTGELVLQKDCSIDDDTIGRLYVDLKESEMRNLEEGFYDYSLVQETRETIDSTDYRVVSRIPLYFDSQYGAIGTLEIVGNLLGTVTPSEVIDTFSRNVDFDQSLDTNLDPPFTLPRPNYRSKFYQGLNPEHYLSNIVDGKPSLTTANSLHTFQFYFDNYLGEVIVQGSINPGSTPAAGDWVDLETFDTAVDTVDYVNIIGKWNWFRIKHTPSENNTGKVDKILYR